MSAALKRIDVFTYTIGAHSITVMDCPRCGEVFGVLESTTDVRRRDGKSFYCPHGHTMSYSIGETLQQRELKEAKRRAEQAERELAEQRRMREWAESRAKGANISAGHAKAQLRRTIERVHAGVCPHCHRTFRQLAAHMQTKHAVKK